MNDYLHTTSNRFGTKHFVDPLMYDTKLTTKGRSGAVAAASRVEALQVKPELLVVSPLRRALQTAQLAWPSYGGAVVVEALARERVWLSSDIGRAPAELAKEFPEGRFDFSHLPDCWWWNGNNSNHMTVLLEPQEVLEARVRDFRAWLMARPETCIAVVTHWGVLAELTGHQYDNCEMRSFVLDPAQDTSEKLRYWSPNSLL